MSNREKEIAYLRRISRRDSLVTSDPYDLWMTKLGYSVKAAYNRFPRLSLFPAGALTVVDLYLNNHRRIGYRQREYPIVRAWVALTCMNYYELNGDTLLLDDARRHLDWLLEHSCQGFSGPCWGLGFDYAVSADFSYGENTPLTTMTPYILEALVRFHRVSNSAPFEDSIRGIYSFFEQDIPVLEETELSLVTAYSTMPDRRVVNAVSYAMYAYGLCLPWLNEQDASGARRKILKLYNFVADQQRSDGSWLYSPDGKSFIDCFHSCIVLKNLKKTAEIVRLPGVDERIEHGYRYLKSAFEVPRKGLFKRFSKSNKPSLIAFDLYDNAEVLNLAVLLGDWALVNQLRPKLEQTFCGGDRIFSQIDRFGRRINPDQLRWAVMPYLYGVSMVELHGKRRGTN